MRFVEPVCWRSQFELSAKLVSIRTIFRFQLPFARMVTLFRATGCDLGTLCRNVTLAFIICLLAFQEVSEAAEWFTTPSIILRQDYDDNVFLSILPHKSVSSTTVEPRLDFGVESYIWKIGGGAELTRRRFSGQNELDVNAQKFEIESFYKTERNAWQLEASSSQTSYLANQEINPDIGLFTANTSSNAKTVEPSWIWSATELSQVRLSLSQSDVSYVNGEVNNLFDYHSTEISVSYIVQYDVYTQFYVTPGYSIFRVPATTYESRHKMLQVGVQRNFSDTKRGSLSLGSRRSSSKQDVPLCVLIVLFPSPFCASEIIVTNTSEDDSLVFGANYVQKFETVSLDVSVSRLFQPTGRGQQARTDSAFIALSKPLTHKLVGKMNVNAYEGNSETGTEVDIDRRVYQLQLGLYWQWVPESYVDISVRHTNLKRDNESTDATSNAVYLTFAYQWPKLSIRR